MTGTARPLRQRVRGWLRSWHTGFSLLEVLLAIVLIGVIAIALLNAFTVSYAAAKDARMLQIAQRLAQITMDTALVNPLAEPVSDVAFEGLGLAGFRYDLEIGGVLTQPDGITRTRLAVTVRYRFLTGPRTFRLEAWRYGF